MKKENNEPNTREAYGRYGSGSSKYADGEKK